MQVVTLHAGFSFSAVNSIYSGFGTYDAPSWGRGRADSGN